MIFLTKFQTLQIPAKVRTGNPIIGYDNVAVRNSLIADTTESGSAVNNLTNDNLSSFWRAASTATQNVTFTQPETTFKSNEIDYVGIARHNFGTGCVAIKIQGRESEDASFADITEEVIPANDAPILFRFALDSYESVRLVMSPSDVAPQMSVLYIGKALQLEHSLEMPGNHTPLQFARSADVLTGRTAANKLFVGRVSIGERYETSANFIMSPTFFRNEVDAFLQAAVEKPFFLAMFPQTYPDDVSFSWLTNDPQPVNQLELDMYRLRLDYSGIVD